MPSQEPRFGQTAVTRGRVGFDPESIWGNLARFRLYGSRLLLRAFAKTGTGFNRTDRVA
jgi:hypothetical protein